MDSSIYIQIHAFANSSEKEYALAVYLRIFTASTVQCNFVIDKSKIAPLKRVTIPCLEFYKAILTAKLLHLVAIP